MPDASDEVFLLKGKDLEPMPARSMREGLLGETLEGALQRFFEQYPQIIPGRQIDPNTDDPPRFILLRREMPIGNWSLDHLFVDQRGVLTLVETKLFENPEARREVIGQIIEYAANAAQVWAGGQARQKASEYWAKLGKSLDDNVREAFGQDFDVDAFWDVVEDNLKEGRIRLIISSDELRSEVRRMIEYLNQEMENAEVLGLELKAYGKQDSVVLVPRLIGQTQATIKGPGKMNVWTESLLRDSYSELPDGTLRQRLEKILKWTVERGVFVKSVSKNPAFGIQGKGGKRILSIYADGIIYVILNYPNDDGYLGGLEGRIKFADELKSLSLLDKTVDPSEVVSGKNASKKLQQIPEPDLNSFFDVLNRYCSTP